MARVGTPRGDVVDVFGAEGTPSVASGPVAGTLPSDAEPMMLPERFFALLEIPPESDRCGVLKAGMEDAELTLEAEPPFEVFIKPPLLTRDLMEGSEEASSGRDKLRFSGDEPGRDAPPRAPLRGVLMVSSSLNCASSLLSESSLLSYAIELVELCSIAREHFIST